MTKKLTLAAEKRSIDAEKATKIRQQGYIPAVVYGSKHSVASLKVKKLDLKKIYEQAGEATLLDLKIGQDEVLKVIIKAVQKNPITEAFEHVDFYQVDLHKSIEVDIPINFVGEAKAVKELGGTLVKNIETINARCLPNDLIENIEVDLSRLNTFEDSIKIESLKCPDTIEILVQPAELIARVLPPRIIDEEEEKANEEVKEGEESKEGSDDAKTGEKEKEGKESEKSPNAEKKSEKTKEKK